MGEVKLHFERLGVSCHGGRWHWVVTVDGVAVRWGYEWREQDAKRKGKQAACAVALDD